MRRYHLLFIIYYSFFCCCGASAQPNARLQELEKTLKEQGFGVTHVQRSSRGIEQRWTSGLHLSSGIPTISKELLQKMSADQLKAFRLRIDSTETARKQRTVEAIDLIRSTFSALASTASESYMYEVHNKECDTIRLSMAWKDESHPLNSWRSDGGVLYDGGREAVMFNFHRPPGKDWSSGYYSHVYTAPYPEPMGDIKSFDDKVFIAVLNGFIQTIGSDHAAIEKDVHHTARSTCQGWLDQITVYFVVIIAELHRNGILDGSAAAHLEDHFQQITLAGCHEGFPAVTVQVERNTGIGQREAADDILDQ